MRARRKISPPSTSPIRASRRSWCRPICRRLHALELARDHRRHHGGRLSDARKSGRSRRASSCSTFRCRKSRARSPLSTARARHSRGVHQLWFCDGEYVHMAAGAPDFKPTIRSTTSSTAASTCAIRQSRPRSGAGGCRARAKATTRAAAAAQARQGLPRAQHQRLSAAAGPALSRLYRRRHVHHGHFRQVEAEADLALDQFAALYRLHPYGAAAVRRAIFWS